MDFQKIPRLLRFWFPILLLLTVSGSAAGLDTLWGKSYGGSNLDYIYDVAPYGDGYVLAGLTYTGTAGKCDGWALRINKRGDTLWARKYGGLNYDGFLSVAALPTGEIVFAGFRNGTSSYPSLGASPMFWVVCANSNGDTNWTRGFERSHLGHAEAVTALGNDLLLATGETKAPESAFSRLYMVSFNRNGDSLWAKSYSRSTGDCGYAAMRASDSSILVCGTSGSSAMWLLKCRPNGDTLWTRSYGRGGQNEAHSILESKAGGYLLTGFTYHANDNYDSQGYLVRTNPNGDTLWTREYVGYGVSPPSDRQDMLEDAVELSNGNLVICGYQGRKGWIIKTDAVGQKIAELGLDSAKVPQLMALAPGNGDTLYCAGQYWPSSTTQFDGRLICLTSTIVGPPPEAGAVALYPEPGNPASLAPYPGVGTPIILTADDSLTVWAKVFAAQTNWWLGDQVLGQDTTRVHWFQAGFRGAQILAHTNDLPYNVCRPRLAPDTGFVVVTKLTATGVIGDTVKIIVLPGAPASLSIEELPGGLGYSFLDDDTLFLPSGKREDTVYAVARDRFGNFVQNLTATWGTTASNNLFTINPGPDSACPVVRVSDNSAGINFLWARALSRSLPVETLCVKLNSYFHFRLEIRDTSGQPYTSGTIHVGDSLSLRAWGQRSDNGLWEPVSVAWSLTDLVAENLPAALASSYVFTPVNPGIGNIVALKIQTAFQALSGTVRLTVLPRSGIGLNELAGLPKSLDVKAHVLPNNGLEFVISMDEPGNFELNVFDARGSRTWSTSGRCASAGRFRLSSANWPSLRNGLKMIELKRTGKRIVRKVVVLK